MENLVLVDFDVPTDWAFIKGLQKSTERRWIVKKFISNLDFGSKFKKFIRYVKYFYYPFIIFLFRKKYANILAWQQFYGLILAFYFKVFHIRRAPNIVVMTFIYKAKKSFVGDIYYRFIKYTIRSGYIRKIVVFSESEKSYYSKLFDVKEELFDVQKLGISDQIDQFKPKKGDYYIAPGRSNRDYNFLVDNWTNKSILKIICDTYKNKTTISNNIVYLNNCHGNDYFEEMSKCYAVIIPLDNTKISSGQLVILQAMMLGKPVIVTKNDTVYDYIESEVNGFIIDKSGVDLIKTINILNNEKIYERISNNARKTFELKFSEYAMGINIGNTCFN